jgi:phosphoglycolate phosphatase
MKYKAVIFDLDGTLLYTLGDISLVINKVLKNLDLPTHPAESYKKLVGHGLKETLKRACLNNCSDEDLERGYLDVVKAYKNNSVITTRPYNGIPELLDALCLQGIKIAILSNKEDSLVQDIADKLLSKWQFSSIRGFLPDVPKKPDPFSLKEMLKEMSIKTSEALFIGDSGVDMKTAVNSGLLGVGATWGYRDIIELTEAGAGILIDKPEDLLKIIG